MGEKGPKLSNTNTRTPPRQALPAPASVEDVEDVEPTTAQTSMDTDKKRTGPRPSKPKAKDVLRSMGVSVRQ